MFAENKKRDLNEILPPNISRPKLINAQSLIRPHSYDFWSRNK